MRTKKPASFQAMVLNQVHAVHGHPKRRMEVGGYVKRRGPVSERDVAMAAGIELGSALKTLALLVEDRSVEKNAAGRYVWVGGDLLLRWADLTEQRRRVLMHLSASERRSTAEIADVSGLDPETVRHEIPALEQAGWVEREEGRQVGGRGKRIPFSRLSEAAAEAIAGIGGKVEISTEQRAAV